uniref:fimbrial protein n=1 Tax=Escherichia coli TaxID=562 RepID=UPI00201B3254
EKRVFLVILFTSFSGSLVSRISGAVHSTFKNVEISFNGVGDADNSKLISVSTEPGAATGVGIGIYDNTNTLVDLNTGKSATVLKEGQTVLYFTANYVSTKDAVTIGYGNAEVDFNLTYN